MRFFKKETITVTAAPQTVEINEDFFYYPKNLRSKEQFILWSLADCVILIGSITGCLLLWSATKISFFLVIPFALAFLSARINDISILTRLKELCNFMFKANSFKNNSKPNSSQKLLGSKYITNDGMYVTETGRIAFWAIEPFNLSVMSPSAVKILVNQLTSVLKQCPGLEIMATDSARSLDDNIAFLKKRIEEETNPAVKKLLESDLTEISNKSQSANNSRLYLFVLKIPSTKSNTQDFATVRRYSKVMQDNGFDAVQLLKPEIKKLLANYFDINASDLPDYDGLQYQDEKGADNFEF